MYSPRIDEALIPTLYHTAKARRMPMTRLVSDLIRKALATEALPREAQESEARSRAPPGAYTGNEPLVPGNRDSGASNRVWCSHPSH